MTAPRVLYSDRAVSDSLDTIWANRVAYEDRQMEKAVAWAIEHGDDPEALAAARAVHDAFWHGPVLE